MRALVLGGSGFLGRSIVPALQGMSSDVTAQFASKRHSFPWSWVRYVFPSDDIGRLIQEHDIDTIVCAATITGQHKSSSGKLDDAALNSNLKRFALKISNLRVLYVSTDAVFQGDKGSYGECDPTDPATEYGREQTIIENALREMVGNLLIVRTSYIYGHSAGNIDRRWKNVLSRTGQGEEVEASIRMVKSPVRVDYLATLVARAANSNLTGVLHAAAPQMSVYDFYLRCVAEHGNEEWRRKLIKGTETPVANSSLVCNRQTEIRTLLDA